jgi:hypothetical protein
MAGLIAEVKEENRFRLEFPMIRPEEARVSVALADKTALVLGEKITNNMTRYFPLLDSLIAAGAVSKDSNSVFEPTTFLYHPYVVVAGMLLWYDMGHRFISDGKPFLMYRRMDICNSVNARYMYAAPDGEGYNGHHFYTYLTNNKALELIFADFVPEVDCGMDFLVGKRLKRLAAWRFAAGSHPDFFVIDTAAARPLLNLLGAGSQDVLAEALSDLEKLAIESGHGELTLGHRYWFWNLVSSTILDRLLAEGVIEKYKKGHFSLGQER